MQLHQTVRDELSSREYASPVYIKYLEDALGISLKDTLVSTAEHLAPFNSITSISFLLPQLLLNTDTFDDKKSICILAASLVPLDNIDYPRGFFLPGHNEPEKKINLFPYRLRKAAPLLLPPVTAKNSELDLISAWNESVARVFSADRNFRSYAEQMAEAMSIMGLSWFGALNQKQLIVRALEDVARKLILQLLTDRDDYLCALLFNQEIRSHVYNRLKHVYCAWGDVQGSFLFWSTKNHQTRSLSWSDGCLQNDFFELYLDAEQVYTDLQQQKIVPSVFLSLFVTSYLAGLPIAGGGYAFHYFPKMIEALNEAFGSRRPLSLPVFAYNASDFSQFKLNDIAETRLPSYGTGLSLAKSPLDPVWLSQELEQAGLIAKQDGGFFK